MPDALYTAHAHATGGREHGHAVTDDGRLDVKLERPDQIGAGEEGTNPEQLFAAGYSACFLGALKLVAGKRGVPADDASVDGSVSLYPEGRGFKLGVELAVTMPGVEREQAEKLVETAHQVCPYSNATRDNIDVALTVR
jgi:lipoyl-dependent peroxiredoxin